MVIARRADCLPGEKGTSGERSIHSDDPEGRFQLITFIDRLSNNLKLKLRLRESCTRQAQCSRNLFDYLKFWDHILEEGKGYDHLSL